MKKFTKFLSVALSATMLVSAFAGCDRTPDDGGEVDDNKTQLRVSNYEGGYGRAWLDNAAERFEEKYKGVSFEDGKMGVQIHVDSEKDGKAGEAFLSGISNTDFHVVVTTDVFYYDVVSKNLALDITDIMTSPLSEFGEEVTIESKMDGALQSFYKTGQGKYYGVPHYEEFYGITYDKDLFNEKGFWRRATPAVGVSDGSEWYAKPNKQGQFTVTLSSGPDGVAGTNDDGLPATYDEFFALCDYMVKNNVTPFTSSGLYISMFTAMMYQLWADYEGKANFQKTVSFEGPMTVINAMADNGTFTTKTVEEFTTANAWEGYNQAGKAAALDFAKRVVSKSSYYSSDMFSNDIDNIRSQANYLGSSLLNKPVAFLVDGVWWENEAEDAGTYGLYEGEYGDSASRMERKFGLLPMPKATLAKVGENSTTALKMSSLVFINKAAVEKNEATKEVAKKFMQFIHTDNELQEFSVTTSALRPFNYTVPASKMANVSEFGKDLLATRNDAKHDTVYMVSNNSLYINDVTKFDPAEAFRTVEGQDPIVLFKNNSSWTVKTIFDKTESYRKNLWK